MSDEKIKLKEVADSPVLKLAEPIEASPPLSDRDASAAVSLSGDASGGPASNLSNAELAKIASHPNASEAEWMRACTALNELEAEPPKRKHSSKRVLGLAALGVLMCVAIGFGYNGSALKEQFFATPKKPLPYVMSRANWQSEELMQRQVIQIAKAIRSRSWSEEKAAAFLAADNVQIGNLINGRVTDFSAEQLNKMVFALGLGFHFEESSSVSEYQDAVDYYSRALELDQDNVRALKHRAEAYAGMHDYKSQLADLEQLLKLRPNQKELLIDRALAYSNASQYKNALADFDEYKRLFPSQDVSQNKAIVYLQMGQWNQSISESTKSIELMKTPRPGPFVNRASAYEEAGKLTEALADYRRVLEIDPAYKSVAEKITRLERQLQKK